MILSRNTTFKHIFVKYMSKVKGIQTKSAEKIRSVVQIHSDAPLKSNVPLMSDVPITHNPLMSDVLKTNNPLMSDVPKSNNPLNENNFFISLVEMLYKERKSDYPLISSNDVERFIQRIDSMVDYPDNNLYDPIVDPLVKTSLAHFLYLKKNGLSTVDINLFHPNLLRLNFIDNIVKDGRSYGYINLYEITLGTSTISTEKIYDKIDNLVVNKYIKRILYYNVSKLQSKGDPLTIMLDYMSSKKTNPFNGMGILYFIIMDLYLENLDNIFYESIQRLGLNCMILRCLNTFFIGYPSKKDALNTMKNIDFDIILPAWGLFSKVRTASKGGKVLRPWKGKLSINHDGLLQWVRPESLVVEM